MFWLLTLLKSMNHRENRGQKRRKLSTSRPLRSSIFPSPTLHLFTFSPFHLHHPNHLDRQRNRLGNRPAWAQAADEEATRPVACVTTPDGKSGEFPVTSGKPLKTLNRSR
jgi:hypothetical protein